MCSLPLEITQEPATKLALRSNAQYRAVSNTLSSLEWQLALNPAAGTLVCHGAGRKWVFKPGKGLIRNDGRAFDRPYDASSRRMPIQ